MSISIISQPAEKTSVYNPSYWVISSTNAAITSNFKYVIDIYEGTTSPINYIGRFKIPAAPDYSGKFNANRILESYVSNYFDAAANEMQPNTISSRIYLLKIGEEYTTGTTGTTVYPNLYTSSNVYVLNSIDKDNTDLYSNYTYYSGNTTPKFLTDWDYSTPKKINRSQYETLGMFFNFCNNIYIQTFNSASTQVGEYVLSSGYSSTYVLYNLGVGTKNLTITATNTLTSSPDTIINTNVHSYTVYAAYNSDQRSPNYNYIIEDDCPKFINKRIAWVGSKGAYEYFNFNLVSRNQFERKNNIWQKLKTYSDSWNQRTVYNLGIDLKEKFTVNTDWLNSAENEYMKSLFSSSEFMLINDTTGVGSPILLTDSNVEFKDFEYDRLVQYTFTFEYAYNRNYIQRT